MRQAKRQPLPVPELPVLEMSGTRIADIVGWRPGAGALVDYPGNPHGPIPALSVVRLDPDWAARPAPGKSQVVLGFESQRSDRPIVLGILETPTGLHAVTDEPASTSALAVGSPVVLVDGRRLQIEGRDEVVLKCGEASITLRRNGRVVIRGAYVETRARGVNRIRGGSVEIN
jgi:hypothetical protein